MWPGLELHARDVLLQALLHDLRLVLAEQARVHHEGAEAWPSERHSLHTSIELL